MRRGSSSISDPVVLSVRLERRTADRLKEIADASYRSVAAEMRRLIEEHVEADDREETVA